MDLNYPAVSANSVMAGLDPAIQRGVVILDLRLKGGYDNFREHGRKAAASSLRRDALGDQLNTSFRPKGGSALRCSSGTAQITGQRGR